MSFQTIPLKIPCWESATFEREHTQRKWLWPLPPLAGLLPAHARRFPLWLCVWFTRVRNSEKEKSVLNMVQGISDTTPCIKKTWFVKSDLEKIGGLAWKSQLSIYQWRAHFQFITCEVAWLFTKTQNEYFCWGVRKCTDILVSIWPSLSILSSHPHPLCRSREDILPSSRRHRAGRGAPAVHEEWRLSPWDYGAGHPRWVWPRPLSALPSLGDWRSIREGPSALVCIGFHG